MSHPITIIKHSVENLKNKMAKGILKIIFQTNRHGFVTILFVLLGW